MTDIEQARALAYQVAEDLLRDSPFNNLPGINRDFLLDMLVAQIFAEAEHAQRK